MNITRQNIDELNATLKLQVSREDYEERVTKKLSDYRHKANMPGFRPGKVPASLIQKMYGKAVLAEEINKLVSEKINEYLKAEDIHVLGDPMPNETENKPIDWENDKEFEFVFDLGLAPEIDLSLGKKDKIISYEILLEDSMVDSYIDSYTRRYGRFATTDVITENELVKGDLVQIDTEGNIVEGGIFAQDSSIYLELAKDENEKKLFIGAKEGDTIKFDIKKAFPNDTELANLLKISKDKVAEAPSTFQFTVHSISRFEKAEFNQELFTKVYGEGVVNSEAEFREKVSSEIRENLQKDSSYKFSIDSKKYLLKKCNFKLPSEFLKRWVTFANEGKISAEQIEKEFPLFEEDMKWQLIKNKFVKDNNFEVKEDEVVEYAKEVTRNQFRQYGISNIQDEHIQSYAVNLLKKEDDVRKMVEKLMEDKVVSFVKDNVTLDNKQITNEEFGKLFAEN
jgi:trigger factor